MVSGLYRDFGFENLSLSGNGDSVWKLDIKNYKHKNNIIKVNEGAKL